MKHRWCDACATARWNAQRNAARRAKERSDAAYRARRRAERLAWAAENKAATTAIKREWKRRRAVSGITDPVLREIRLAMYDFKGWKHKHPGEWR